MKIRYHLTFVVINCTMHMYLLSLKIIKISVSIFRYYERCLYTGWLWLIIHVPTFAGSRWTYRNIAKTTPIRSINTPGHYPFRWISAVISGIDDVRLRKHRVWCSTCQIVDGMCISPGQTVHTIHSNSEGTSVAEWVTWDVAIPGFYQRKWRSFPRAITKTPLSPLYGCEVWW